MTLWPCLYSPSGASARRKLHTLSSIGPHIFGNSAHGVAAITTAVGVRSTVFRVTSTLIPRIVGRPAVAVYPCPVPGHHLCCDRAQPARRRDVMLSVIPDFSAER